MKRKEIVAGVLALGVLVGSGYGIYGLSGNNILGNAFKTNVVYAEKGEVNQDFDTLAKEVIEKYFGKTPDYDSMVNSTMIHTKAEQIEAMGNSIELKKEMVEKLKIIDVDEMEGPSVKIEKANEDNIQEVFKNIIIETKENMGADEAKERLYTLIESTEKSIDSFEEMKNSIKYGTVSVNWESDDERYTVIFDDQTKKLLTAKYEEKINGSEINAKDFILMEEAEGLAEDFLTKNKLDGIENMALVKAEEFQNHLKDEVGGGFDFNAVAFFYEDEKDSDKKATVVIDRVTGEVIEFSLGKATEDITYKTSPY